MKGSYIAGCAHYLPDKILTNDDLSKTVETSNEWIVKRTGILKRHIVADHQTTSDMGINAAYKLFSDYSIDKDQIDGIIVATTTPDKTFPSTAIYIQKHLKTKGFAFDLQAVCAGFGYAMSVADSMIKNDIASNIIVIGAESMSKIINWNDRGTCVLFGDGAGCVLVKRRHGGIESQIIDHKIDSDPNLSSILDTTGGICKNQTAGKIQMDGRLVFKYATSALPGYIINILKKSGIKKESVKYFILHQANVRIIENIARHLDIDINKFLITLDMCGNTSAASVPITLSYHRDKIKRGRYNSHRHNGRRNDIRR